MHPDISRLGKTSSIIILETSSVFTKVWKTTKRYEVEMHIHLGIACRIQNRGKALLI